MSAPAAGRVLDEVPVDPARGRIYAEGWQSWSPATWFPAGATGPVPAEEWIATMRFRPGTPVDPAAVQGEGLLVVDPGTGAPARCYGTTDGSRVPTLRAALRGDRVVVVVDGPQDVLEPAEHADGGEAALAAYGDRFAATAGAQPLREPPTVWCSWYRYFEQVTAGDVLENLAALAEHRLPADVVLLDDGWSLGLGEHLRPAPRFGPLDPVVRAVEDGGRRTGIWLAPFLVGADTPVAREHPEWLVGGAGRNWRQDLVGLDLTHPGVRDLLRSRLEPLVERGIRYFKLDFLYGGAVPGRRHSGEDPVAAYRSGLRLLREILGPDAYLVACGAPILPSVGLVDGMRVSPDTFHEGGEDGSRGLRGLMPLAARAWQQGRFWVNDPDCLVARPSYRLREPWAQAVTGFGGLRSVSDRIAELDEWGLETTRRLLESGSSAEPFPARTVRAAADVAAAQLAALAVEDT
jgi:alpha-galactosidase